MKAQSAKRVESRAVLSAKSLEKLEKSRGGYGLAGLFGNDEEVAPKRVRRPKFEKVRVQSAKRVARRAAQSAKRLEKLEKSRGGYGLGNLYAEPDLERLVIIAD